MPVTINGSAGVTTNSGAVYDSLQRGTAVTASGTSVDFTSIPSWVRRITVMFNGVSTNGTSNILIQLGAGSVTTSGYTSSNGLMTAAGTNYASSTAGILMGQVGAAADTFFGAASITLISSNIWSAQGCVSRTNSAASQYLSGGVSLSGVLDRVRITTVNGTDTFDAGTINIIYE